MYFIWKWQFIVRERKKQLINLHEQNGIEDIYFFKIDNDLYGPEIRVVGIVGIVDIGSYFS